jgi:hypothetical protein
MPNGKEHFPRRVIHKILTSESPLILSVLQFSRVAAPIVLAISYCMLIQSLILSYRDTSKRFIICTLVSLRSFDLSFPQNSFCPNSPSQYGFPNHHFQNWSSLLRMARLRKPWPHLSSRCYPTKQENSHNVGDAGT